MTHRIEGPNEQIISEVKEAIAESNKDTARLDNLIKNWRLVFRALPAMSREIIDDWTEES